MTSRMTDPPRTQPLPRLPERYQFREALGRGGMGAVLRVRDRTRDQDVALKILVQADVEEALQRFRREIRILAEVSHAGIVSLLDWGTLPSGRPFFTMPYLADAVSLDRWILRRMAAGAMPPEPADVVTLFRPLAAALDHVHQRGLCHRDLKPGNILVRSGGGGVLLDFGLVGILGDHVTRITATGDIVGTLSYLSPEHIRNQTVGPASDVFQLGLVLYEVLTGRRRVKVPLEFVRYVVQGRSPFDDPDDSPTLAASIKDILARALRLDPGDRLASAGEILVELEALTPGAWYEPGGAVAPPDGVVPAGGSLTFEETRSGRDHLATGPGSSPAACPELDRIVADPPGGEPGSGPLPPSAWLDPGEDPDGVLGASFRRRYVLERVLGRGSAGIVYGGRDEELDRPVAIKLLRRIPGGPDDEGPRRFAREARLLARISHPNLVKIYDLFEERDVLAIVSELVEGEPFDRIIARDAPLALDPVRRLALDVTRGLEALHGAGVVHRDIKPSNLMGTAAGARILDLGIAHVMDGTLSGLTRTGQLIGTPAWCSPEQIQGLAVGPATDLYSLGLVLYQALTGRLPFEGTLIEMLAARARSDPTPVDTHRPVPPRVRDLIQDLLARDPSERPSGAAAVRERLQRRWSDRPTRSTRPPRPTAGPAPGGPPPAGGLSGQDAVGIDPPGSDPAGGGPTGTRSAGTRPAGTDPVGTDPTGADPIRTEPVRTDPIRTDPAGARRGRPRPRHRRMMRPAVAALAGALLVIVITSVVVLTSIRWNRPTFSAPRIESRLTGVRVFFDRDPPGPASLRVRWEDGHQDVFRSPGRLAHHRFDLPAPGTARTLALTPVDDRDEGPTLTCRHEPAGARNLAMTGTADSLALAFETPVPATSRLRARGAGGTVWLGANRSRQTTHVFEIPLARMPYAPPILVELRSGDESLEVRIGPEAPGRSRYLAQAGAWFESAVAAFLRRFDGYNQASASTAADRSIATVLGDYRLAVADLDRDLPGPWFLEAVGGPGGLLDHPGVDPVARDRLYRNLFVLELWDLVRDLLAVDAHYPHEKLYGPHFGPALGTRYPSAHVLPILLEGLDPARPFRLAADAPYRSLREEVASRPDCDFRATGTVHLGRLSPTTRAEIQVRAFIAQGRQIHVLVNDRYQVRLNAPTREPLSGVHEFVTAFDPRYLQPGENRFEFTAPPLPEILENIAPIKLIDIEPPGFTLRLAE